MFSHHPKSVIASALVVSLAGAPLAAEAGLFSTLLSGASSTEQAQSSQPNLQASFRSVTF